MPPTLTTTEAASMLGVSPRTLHGWEHRYGWPKPTRSPGGHRRYDAGDIESLAACLPGSRDSRSAVTQAQTMADVYTICPHCRKQVDRLLVRIKKVEQ